MGWLRGLPRLLKVLRGVHLRLLVRIRGDKGADEVRLRLSVELHDIR